MISVPPPAPLTSTGLLRAAGASVTVRPPAPAPRASSARPHHADAALDERRHHRVHHRGAVALRPHEPGVARAAVAAAVFDPRPHHPDAEGPIAGGRAVADDERRPAGDEAA